MNKDSMTRRKLLTGVAIAGASSLLLRADVAIAAEPTLDETLDWLAGKINTEGRYEYRITKKDETTIFHQTSSVESWKKDNFIVKSILIVTWPNDQRTYTDAYTFNLADFNPAKIEIEEYAPGKKADSADGDKIIYVLHLHTTNDKPSVSRLHQEKGGKYLQDSYTERKVSFVSGVGFTDKSLVERVVKALTYAIRLCGGKETKEPF